MEKMNRKDVSEEQIKIEKEKAQERERRAILMKANDVKEETFTFDISGELLVKKELENIDEPLLEGMPFDYGGEDLGNISRVIPICNPYITIFPDYKISNHTEQFRELANSDAGYHCIEVSGKAMTRTLIDLFLEPDIIDQAKKELQERLEHE